MKGRPVSFGNKRMIRCLQTQNELPQPRPLPPAPAKSVPKIDQKSIEIPTPQKVSKSAENRAKRGPRIVPKSLGIHLGQHFGPPGRQKCASGRAFRKNMKFGAILGPPGTAKTMLSLLRGSNSHFLAGPRKVIILGSIFDVFGPQIGHDADFGPPWRDFRSKMQGLKNR